MPRTTRSSAKSEVSELQEAPGPSPLTSTSSEQITPESGQEASSSTPAPATFSGRLDLLSYGFTATRRSSDRVTRSSTSSSVSTTTRAASTPGKANSGPRGTKRAGPSSGISTTTTTTTAVATASGSSAHFPAAATSHSKRRRIGKNTPSSYAPPSTYSHLPLLPDAMAPNLLVMFVGLNPGIETARSGHAYAHPSNLFWKLLYSSGLTTRPCRPEEDQDMPRLFSLGLTNIVGRASRNGAELSKGEMDAGVGALERKARRTRAEVVCIVGKSIWESVFRVKHGRPLRKGEFEYGWQEGERMGRGVKLDAGEKMEGEDEDAEPYPGARVFVATSTSGLAATLSLAEKQRIWRQLGEWAEGRRVERAREAVTARAQGQGETAPES